MVPIRRGRLKVGLAGALYLAIHYFHYYNACLHRSLSGRPVIPRYVGAGSDVSLRR